MTHDELKERIAKSICFAIEQRRQVALSLAQRGYSAFFPLISNSMGSNSSPYQGYLFEEVSIETSKQNAVLQIFGRGQLDAGREALRSSHSKRTAGSLGLDDIVSKAASVGPSAPVYLTQAAGTILPNENSKQREELIWSTWARFYFEGSLVKIGDHFNFFDESERIRWAEEKFRDLLREGDILFEYESGFGFEKRFGLCSVIVLCSVNDLLRGEFIGDHFMQSPEFVPEYRIAINSGQDLSDEAFAFPISEVLPYFFESYRYVRNAPQLQLCIDAHAEYLKLILQLMADDIANSFS